MKDKNLCLINHRFQAVNTDSKVLIYEHKDACGALAQDNPYAEIPVKERRSDREACLLAMAWLREHRKITSGEYLREVEKFLLTEAAHPTEAVDCDRVSHCRSGSIKRDGKTTTIRQDGLRPDAPRLYGGESGE